MKKRVETNIIQNTGRTVGFNSWEKVLDNHLKYFKKREGIDFLSFFYELLFFNPNHVFGFFLSKKRSET